VGGAVLLAALTVSGSAAVPAARPAAPVPQAAAPGVPATGRYIDSGAVFQIDVSYTCPSKSTGQLSLDVHQNLGDGFVANGFGYARRSLTCNSKKHSVRITVVPSGERGFMRGPAYAITDFFSCPPKSQACEPTTLERTIAVR
jgi:hypothetical protein